MKLYENQLRLIWHLCRFSLLDYESCLHLLDTEETGDRVALSYAFRPLTKNKYLSRQKAARSACSKRGKHCSQRKRRWSPPAAERRCSGA